MVNEPQSLQFYYLLNFLKHIVSKAYPQQQDRKKDTKEIFEFSKLFFLYKSSTYLLDNLESTNEQKETRFTHNSTASVKQYK